MRMTLGATAPQVRVLVMRQAFALVLAGVVVGLPAAGRPPISSAACCSG